MNAPRPADAVDVLCIASWNTDLTCHIDAPLQKGQTVAASGFTIGPGGKGSNAAVACARQGARTAVVARIGTDAFGNMGLALWAREGIATQHVTRVEGEPSGVAQILIYPDGDNSIAVAAGANAGLSTQHIAQAADTLAHARVLMASCEVPLPATLAAFELARQCGVTTLLNPAPALLLPEALLACCDVLTPNEHEVRAIVGLPPSAPLEAAAEWLLSRGVSALVVTLGEQGCLLFEKNKPLQAIPAWRVEKVIDTVGAGDTFTGALAAALARGDALAPAVRHANAAAALSVTGQGAIGGMPSHEQTEAFMQSHTQP